MKMNARIYVMRADDGTLLEGGPDAVAAHRDSAVE